MSTTRWMITFKLFRQKEGSLPYFDDYRLEVDPDEYVLDALERIWAYKDRSLVFRHACHHSTCGACGMRVNGVEKLTCITPIRSLTSDGGTLQVEPLRNFPVVSDLAVDMGTLYTRMEAAGHRPLCSDAQEAIQPEARPAGPQPDGQDFLRLSDCIECGLCISACPIPSTAPDYLGPAVLAGIQQHGISGDECLLSLADSQDGVWRCHSAFECTAVCPSFVDPGWRIMELRKQVMVERFRQLFRRGRRVSEVSQ